MEHKEMIKLVKKVAKLYDESGATLNDVHDVENYILRYMRVTFSEGDEFRLDKIISGCYTKTNDPYQKSGEQENKSSSNT